MPYHIWWITTAPVGTEVISGRPRFVAPGPYRSLSLASLPRSAEEEVGTWALRTIEASCSQLRSVVARWRADRPPPSDQWMGQDLDAALLFADQLNFLDTFGAVCGALRGGGVLLLCTPPWREWRRQRGGDRWCRELEVMSKKGAAVQFVREEDMRSEPFQHVDGRSVKERSELKPVEGKR